MLIRAKKITLIQLKELVSFVILISIFHLTESKPYAAQNAQVKFHQKE